MRPTLLAVMSAIIAGGNDWSGVPLQADVCVDRAEAILKEIETRELNKTGKLPHWGISA